METSAPAPRGAVHLREVTEMAPDFRPAPRGAVHLREVTEMAPDFRPSPPRRPGVNAALPAGAVEVALPPEAPGREAFVADVAPPPLALPPEAPGREAFVADVAPPPLALPPACARLSASRPSPSPKIPNPLAQILSHPNLTPSPPTSPHPVVVSDERMYALTHRLALARQSPAA